MKLLYYIEMSRGGIADYAHAQATALAERGIQLDMLCPASFAENRKVPFSIITELSDWRKVSKTDAGKLRKFRMANQLLRNFRTLEEKASKGKYDAVLMHYSEYLAPLWAWRMRRLKKNGIKIVSVLHDPDRDYQLGPKPWHELSIRQAFSFVDLALVHTKQPIQIPGPADIKWIPHGNYAFPPPDRTSSEVRQDLGIPRNAKLALSYGFLRDNKNLALGIKALSKCPEMHLLIAGSSLNDGSKPLSYYQQLAEHLGCADRCHWLHRFISFQETANLMSASDVLLLTYSSAFVSWSGVLSLAANYELPSIVSAGDPTFGDLVEKYKIGLRVGPDIVSEIIRGLEFYDIHKSNRDWTGYKKEISWSRNAELLHSYITKMIN